MSVLTLSSRRPRAIYVTYRGKVAGSTVENPNISKYGRGSSLLAPDGAWIGETDVAGIRYSNFWSINASSSIINSTTTVGTIAQQLFNFDIKSLVEVRQVGIPGSTLQNKIDWLKSNVAMILCHWYGSGIITGGNKAIFALWNNTSSTWTGAIQHTSPNPEVLTKSISSSMLTDNLDSNGFVNFIAYTDPTDGSMNNAIRSEYIDLIIYLK